MGPISQSSNSQPPNLSNQQVRELHKITKSVDAQARREIKEVEKLSPDNPNKGALLVALLAVMAMTSALNDLATNQSKGASLANRLMSGLASSDVFQHLEGVPADTGKNMTNVVNVQDWNQIVQQYQSVSTATLNTVQQVASQESTRASTSISSSGSTHEAFTKLNQLVTESLTAITKLGKG